MQLRHAFAKKRAQKLIKEKWEKLTPEQSQEFEDWIIAELTEGKERTITKDELKTQITDFGKKHGFPEFPEDAWKELMALFDQTDTNDDGQIDLDEMIAAM